jgi:glutathione synthase/RimK-type ligase-like ATP-grasp enzyme
MRIAIATCADLPLLDEDGPGLLQALSRRGVHATPAVWDDPSVPWDAFDAVVLRSTWNYPARWNEFQTWLDRTAERTRLINPIAVVRWNLDKRYLREISLAGVPIVPTQWVETDRSLEIDASWSVGDVVVKPAISAGSKDTGRFNGHDGNAIGSLVQHIVASGRAAMIQPYLRGVDRHGETAMIFLGGVYSHAIRKGPLLRVGAGLEQGLFRLEAVEPREPTPDERSLADRVFDALPCPRNALAYARIDVVRGDDGQARVIEVELIEPSLFLQHAHGATDRFADVLEEMLKSAS